MNGLDKGCMPSGMEGFRARAIADFLRRKMHGRAERILPLGVTCKHEVEFGSKTSLITYTLKSMEGDELRLRYNTRIANGVEIQSEGELTLVGWAHVIEKVDEFDRYAARRFCEALRFAIGLKSIEEDGIRASRAIRVESNERALVYWELALSDSQDEWRYTKGKDAEGLEIFDRLRRQVGERILEVRDE